MHQRIQNNDELNKLKKRIFYLAPKYGQDPEDLYQEVVLFFLEHPKSKASVKQIIIDILRRSSGRSEDAAYSSRINFMRPGNIDDVKEALLGVLDPESQMNAQLDIKKAWPKLNAKQQNLIYSLFFLGLTGFELSEKRNVTEALISADKYRTFDIIKKELEGNC